MSKLLKKAKNITMFLIYTWHAKYNSSQSNLLYGF